MAVNRQLARGAGFAALATWCLGASADEVRWPGTMERPAEGIDRIVFVVEESENGRELLGLVFLDEPFPISDVRWGDDKVTFAWEPGSDKLECTLALDDDGMYSGECPLPDSDDPLKMSMQVPDPEESEEVPDTSDASDVPAAPDASDALAVSEDSMEFAASAELAEAPELAETPELAEALEAVESAEVADAAESAETAELAETAMSAEPSEPPGPAESSEPDQSTPSDR